MPLTGVMTSASVPPSQGSAVGSVEQTLSVAAPVAVPVAPTAVMKQPEPVGPYTELRLTRHIRSTLKEFVCAMIGNLPRNVVVIF